MKKILLIDDELTIQNILKKLFSGEACEVVSALDGIEAIEKFSLQTFDLIILDILIPKLDGISVCQNLRRQTNIPIIIISCKGSLADIATGFGAGCDDYLVKPFEPEELVIRSLANIRRYNQIIKADNSNNSKHPFHLVNELKIDLAARRVEIGDKPIRLTTKEFELIALLAKNSNKFLTSDEIISELWSSEESTDNNSLMSHISKLRKKIEPDVKNPKYIICSRKLGYKLNCRD